MKQSPWPNYKVFIAVGIALALMNAAGELILAPVAFACFLGALIQLFNLKSRKRIVELVAIVIGLLGCAITGFWSLFVIGMQFFVF